MKGNRKVYSLLSTMVTELLLFLFISIVITVVVVVIFTKKVVVDKMDYYDTPFVDNITDFEKGDFENINIEKQLGIGGYFIVYDGNNAIYTSTDTVMKLDKDLLPFIPQEKHAEIIKTYLTDESMLIEYKNLDDEVIDYAILNGNAIEYLSFKVPNKFVNENSCEVLTGVYNNYKIRKAYFKILNKDYTVVFFTKNYNADTYDYEILISVIYIFTIIISILIITLCIYLVRINHKITKPLETLQQIVEEFKIGKDVSIEYKGPAEFVELFNRFKILSKELFKLEQEKINSHKEKQRILSDISHDLKTPIAVIKSYANTIYSDLLSEDEKKEYLKVITYRADDLTSLINEFSDYNKLESPEFKLNVKRINIYEYVRDYFISKYDELQFLGYELEINIPERNTKVWLDEFQMKKVFDNIISNTLKYNDNKTKIYIEIAEEEKECLIRIGDDGIGIPIDIRDRIFSPFVMGDKARSSGKGSGLGLSIVKKIVELHNGVIYLIPIEKSNISTEYEMKLPKI